MDRLTAQLRSLADDDAARTDPPPATVERGWTRLCGALAVPAAAPVGAALSLKKIGGVLAVLALGVAAAAAPSAIEGPPTPVEPAAIEAPRALEPAPTPVPPAFVAVPPPPSPRSEAAPAPAPAPARKRAVIDPLVAQLRALATARAHLDGGRFRQALTGARKLLRSRDSQLVPEARAIEAVAACELQLPGAAELATTFFREHPSSPHRKRVTATCRR